MKKIILVVILVVVMAAGVGVALYFGGGLSSMPSLSGIIKQTPPVVPVEPSVVPPSLSLAGKIMNVPELAGVSTTLDVLFPTSRRDYPMGRFTSADGVVSGTLVAFDEYITPYENNRRAVPIAVNTAGTGSFYYLAILEGDDMRHATSVYIGDRIRLTSVVREGNQVSVNYFVHDKNQAFEEVPLVPTTAIIDINTGAVIQAGRTPASEVVVVTKNFTGRYQWLETEQTDGTKVTPATADRFFMIFDANRVTLETDCNTGGATFTAGSGSSTVFTVDEIVSTKMFCDSKQEGLYFEMLRKVKKYSESENGILTLELADGGTMTFASVAKKLEFEKRENATTTTTTSS